MMMTDRLLGIVFALVVAPAITAGQTTISRADVVEHLSADILFSSRLDSTHDAGQLEALRADIQQRIARLAEEVLPPALPVPANAGVDVSQIAGGLLVSTTNPELIDLLIRKSLMEAKLQSAFVFACEPPSSEVSSKILANVDRLVQGLRKSMRKHLGSELTSDEIDNALKGFRTSLAQKISSRTTYAFKKPCSPESIDAFLADYDDQVAADVNQFVRRRSTAEREMDPAKAEEHRRGMVNMLLHQILNTRPASFLAEATSDPELAAMSPDRYAPGYTDLCRRIGELERAESRSELAETRSPAEQPCESGTIGLADLDKALRAKIEACAPQPTKRGSGKNAVTIEAYVSLFRSLVAHDGDDHVCADTVEPLCAAVNASSFLIDPSASKRPPRVLVRLVEEARNPRDEATPLRRNVARLRRAFGEAMVARYQELMQATPSDDYVSGLENAADLLSRLADTPLYGRLNVSQEKLAGRGQWTRDVAEDVFPDKASISAADLPDRLAVAAKGVLFCSLADAQTGNVAYARLMESLRARK